jgi:acyl-[acyl-carrier-protein]-phospholipid O-acyltransferase/long-chain-fatty-acid--[acyl-carrier-protein] ligase
MSQPTEPKPSERGFWHLVILQFQGAFSDNVLKQLIILGLVAVLYRKPADQDKWNSVVLGLFVLPGLLVSIWAGMLADKFSKRTIALATKTLEIVTMTLAVGAFASGDPKRMFPLALPVLFLLAVQYTLFGPAKYGIIPELVSAGRLSWANGVVELSTFVAIIAGTGIVPLLLKWLGPAHFQWIGAGLIGLAGLGLLAGLGIDRTAPANPSRRFEWNCLPEFVRYCRLIGGDRALFLTNLGLCYFWFIGVLVLTHVNVWGEHSLGLASADAGWLYVLLSLGIGLGALTAGYLSRGRIEMGLVPMGGLAMAVFAVPMAVATPRLIWMESFCVFMVGMGGGFFSLPLLAMLQHLADPRDRGGVIAANNIFNSAAMVLASVSLFVLSSVFHLSANAIFGVAALLSLAATVVILKLLPEALLRFVAILLTTAVYRIRAIGLEKIPRKGGVLMLCNHVSYIDALLLSTISPRPIRFIAWSEFFDKPFLGFFLRTTRSIPVGSEQRPRDLLRSLKVASDALRAGEVVCLFPEGELTRTGQMLPFRRGYELILRGHAAPIVPVYMDGVWGSIFSYERERFFWKLPQRLPYPVRIVFGDPMPPETDAFVLRQRVEELGAEAALAARRDRLALHAGLVRAARRHWATFAMVDPQTPKPLTRGHALTGSILFARRLAPLWKDQRVVGVLLPPSVGAALVNFAATLGGRAAVNLNYTLGQAALEHCARISGIRTIVTSRKFLEKVGLTPPAEPIFLEDHRDRLGGPLAKLAALAVARLAPVGLLVRWCRPVQIPTIDSLATIIFSSGSTDLPKGIPLTHFNIASNVESFRQAIQFYPTDRLMGTLPFFHSFGYTVSLWGAATIPFGCVYYMNPLDAKAIGELIEKHRVTLLISTPTFLQMYARRLPASQLGGVNLVVAGAERLPDHVYESFRAQFGLEPLQGYGTTECSPVVSVNVPDHRSPGIRQVGNKRGSIGHPLPGVATRVVDVDTRQVLGPGQPGLLEVRGANVMSGYLGLPEKTAEALRDGWYNTGDMATVDEDGFIFITGRLSRFSKIGGEMVPHVTVEDKLHALLKLEDRMLVVTGVPDEKKGEQLVVLHVLTDEQLAALWKALPDCGLPHIFIPRHELFFRVEALPLLGSGKLDLRAVNALAARLAAGPKEASAH